MMIQIRLRAPNGQARIEVDDEANLGALIGLVKEKTELIDFSLKYGYPLKNLDIGLDAQETPIKELQLRGETLTVVPIEAPAPVAIPQAPPKPFTPKGIEPDETSLEWPERGGHIGRFIAAQYCHIADQCSFTSNARR
jgi:ubiquitin thioesterase OTU1